MGYYPRGSEWRKWDLHVHTASSYDAYKGSNADDLLCKALIDNEIAVVAITDHFIIDSKRISNLRELAPNITFLPEVELRTDKGSTNLHINLIFSENTDLEILSSDFEAIMIRQKAKAKDKNETIHWTFEDIIEFSNKQGALVSIHAGKKTNGIDKEITNATPVNIAIKEDIAKEVHFFELGKISDIEDYHNPQKYSTKETLWIIADPTFEGLTQCIYQPSERVFIGSISLKIDKVEKNKRTYIESVAVKKLLLQKIH